MGVDENFVYTTTPTPGAENKINPLIRINEVSNGATEDTCNGRPWLEVNVLQGRGDRNAGPLDFTDVVLTNDQAGGSGNHVSFTFPAVEYREGYSVLCMMGEDPATSPQFLITQGDTVSMLDPFGHTFSAIVYSHLEGMSAGTSYSYNAKTGSFEDTTTPTPGEDNVFTKYTKTKSYLKESLDMLAPVEVCSCQSFMFVVGPIPLTCLLGVNWQCLFERCCFEECCSKTNAYVL